MFAAWLTDSLLTGASGCICEGAHLRNDTQLQLNWAVVCARAAVAAQVRLKPSDGIGALCSAGHGAVMLQQLV
jgi:hypothetical protein